MHSLTYKSTLTASFIGYIVQAIVNNFVPLLFLTLQREFSIPLSEITLLVTINFGVQLLTDLVSARIGERMNYRIAMVTAHGMAALGLILLCFLPGFLPIPFFGILLSVVIYAVGGGLLEVLVSPIVEACPTENKEAAMSMLHSFYCWGHVGVVLLSALFFRFFGIANWRIMALLWAIVPIINGILFLRVPIASLIEEGEQEERMGSLLRSGIFWLLFLMMICAGASEQAVSQWASTFAEQALGVSKTIGDLFGPMAFAVCMGTSRAIYGKFGDTLDLNKFMLTSAILCIASYLMISLVPVPAVGLIGTALCGFSVGIMWPGTFSKAAAI